MQNEIKQIIDLHKLPNENEEQYIWRIAQLKDSGKLDMSWLEISKIINETFRSNISEYRNESAYRKPYQEAKRYYEAGVFKDLTVEKYLKLIQKQKVELLEERQKLRDERTDYQRTVREKSRKESFIETIEKVFEKTIQPLESNIEIKIDSDNDLVVCLSDMHTGIEIKNWWNNYNIEILKERLNKYLNKIISIQHLHKCKNCNLVLGGDEISGIIHSNLRLQNNENVIEQLKISIEFISDFINNLQKYFENVEVYAVAGNHSRITPNKEENLKGENFEEMIMYCLSLKFQNNRNVKICNSSRIDNTISFMETRGGKLFYIVHGDKDTTKNVVQNLTLMTGKKPDGIIMGHKHHNAVETIHGVKVLQSGCVSGMDDYCVDKRISGKPEQLCFITNKNIAVDCIYNVEL